MINTNPKYRLITMPDERSFEETNLFNAKLDQLIKENQRPILVNCENIEMIYSSGLGILIDAYKKCNQRKILFTVVNIGSAIQSVIRTTKLYKVLNTFPTLEEYEISEIEDGIVGTKVPPLNFSYEEADLGGYKIFNCKGVMCQGPTMSQLLSTLKNFHTAIFNFTHLSFIDADCLDDFKTICDNIELYCFGTNDIVLDEFKLFEMDSKIKFKPSLKEIQALLTL